MMKSLEKAQGRDSALRSTDMDVGDGEKLESSKETRLFVSSLSGTHIQYCDDER